MCTPRAVCVPAAGDRAGLHHPADPQHVPLISSGGLGCDHQETCSRIYTAPSEAAAQARLTEFPEKWGAWAEFIPFLDYDVQIRRVICGTNAIESLNARYRRTVRAKGHLPTDQAASKCLYLVTRSLDPPGRGKARWVTRWKPALNAFAITIERRLELDQNQ